MQALAEFAANQGSACYKFCSQKENAIHTVFPVALDTQIALDNMMMFPYRKQRCKIVKH